MVARCSACAVDAPRPVLLVIVYGIFIAIVGVTAMAQTIMVSAQFSTSTINNVDRVGYGPGAPLRHGSPVSEDVGPTGPDAERLARPGRTAQDAGGSRQDRARRGTAAGRDASSRRTDPKPEGRSPAITIDFATALEGRTATAGIDLNAESEAMGPALEPASVLREYFPLVTDGGVMGVVAVWRDAEPILTQLDQMRRNVVLLTVSAGLIAAAVLFLVFRSAQKRISRQTGALIEASRQDVLTGRLNHGALVDAVAEAVEHGRTEGRAFSVALIDVDNFRLLNEMYGHGAGDDALLTVVEGPGQRGARERPRRAVRARRADAARPGGGGPRPANRGRTAAGRPGGHVRCSSSPPSSCR